MTDGKQTPELTVEEVHRKMLECRLELNDRLAQGDATMAELTKSIQTALDMLSELETAMGTILAIYKAGEGFVKVTIVIGKVIKWVSAVIAAVATVWAILHFGSSTK